jgi:hypothetical protein
MPQITINRDELQQRVSDGGAPTTLRPSASLEKRNRCCIRATRALFSSPH